MNRLTFFKVIAFLILLTGCIHTEKDHLQRQIAQDVQKQSICSKEDISGCVDHSHLKFLLKNEVKAKDLNRIRQGQSFSPALTPTEEKEQSIFCKYYFHEFSSAGSAKFMCAKTNARGQFYNSNGEIEPEAFSVATKKMNLKAQLNGIEVSVDEGVLLDQNFQPLKKVDETNKESFVEADEYKVKYFIDDKQTKNHVSRKDENIQFGGENIVFKNAFIGPDKISNYRWTEIFTEVLSAKIFWLLGLPSDSMKPLKAVYCFGCESHPKEQKKYSESDNSVFRTVAVEKKLKGRKLADTFDFKEISKKLLHGQLTEEQKNEFENLILATRLIGYTNASASQNRLFCPKDKYEKISGECQQPVVMIQDLGGSFAWRLNGKFDELSAYLKFHDRPRGDYKRYAHGKIFKDQCRLTFPFGHVKEGGDSDLVSKVSQKSVESFVQRLQVLTPDVLEFLLKESRFAEADPAFVDEQSGSSYADKSEKVTQLWKQAILNKMNEIKNASCED